MTLGAQDLLFIIKMRDEASATLRKIQAESAALGNAARKVGADSTDGFGQLASVVKGASGAFTALKGALAALAIQQTTKAAIDAAMAIGQAGDQTRKWMAQLALSTGSVGEAGKYLEKLRDLSAQTGTELEASVGAFNRFANAARSLGATNAQVLTLVETIQKFAASTGMDKSELSSGLMQLGQALSSGELRGDELRTVLETMPPIANAIAKNLGVGVGALRQMAEEGKLTADKVFGAILRASKDAEEAFKTMPMTIDRAANEASISWQKFATAVDNTYGISQKIQAVFLSLSGLLNKGTAEIAPTLEQQIASAERRARELANELSGAQSQAADNTMPMPGSPQIRIQGKTPSLAAADAAAVAAKREEIAANNALLEALRALQRENAAIDAEDARRVAINNATTAGIERRRVLVEALNKVERDADPIAKAKFERDERLKKISEALAAGAITEARATELKTKVNKDYQEAVDKENKVQEIAQQKASDRNTLLEEAKSLVEGAWTEQEKYNHQLERLNLLLKSGVFDNIEDYYKAVEKLDPSTDNLRKLNDELDVAKAKQRMGALGLSESDQAIELAGLQQRQELAKKGIDLTSEAAQRQIYLAKEIARTTSETERQKKVWDDLANVVEQSFDSVGNALTEAFTQGKASAVSFYSVVNGILSAVMQQLIKLSIINPILNSVFGGSRTTISDVWSSIGSKGSYAGTSALPVELQHSGGFAGESRTHRSVTPDIFRGARRYHIGGLAMDEVPIVAKRGEGIFTPRQMDNADMLLQSALAGPKVTVNVINQSGVDVQTRQSSDGAGGMNLDIILRDKMRTAVTGGALDNVMRQRFGLSPQGQGARP